jgi:hypothetical protein
MLEAKCEFPVRDWPSDRELLVAHGPLLVVDIGFDPQFDSTKQKKPAKLAARGVYGLIGTGAIESFIDNSLARRLDLPAIDKQEVAGAIGGPQLVTMYLGLIYIPALRFTIEGNFGGVDLSEAGMRCQALLGRDFLMHFEVAYDGLTGTVRLRNPSRL